MTTGETLDVTTPTERDILLKRRFDAPRRLVFDAWTRPELLKRWLLGPPGWSMVVCEIDLKVGGSYRFAWLGSDGRGLEMRGVYREIVPSERLVSTEAFDEPWYPGEALITTVLVEQDGRTMVTSTLRYESREARDAVIGSNMAHGVAASYDRLAEVLAATPAREDV